MIQTATTDLAEIAVRFQRDFYIKSPAEMEGAWLLDNSARKILPHIAPALPEPCRVMIKAGFKDHNPFWEFTRAFIYHGMDFDDESRKMVSLADFYLDDCL